MDFQLTNLVPDQVVKALCNTLVHSLWQGLILAVVTGITILLTKRSSAAVRYNLMIGYLLVFTLGIAFTFYKQLPSAATHFTARITAPVSPTLQVQTINVQHQTAEQPTNVISAGIGFFNAHANVIVLIWFLIICARCVQFAMGLQGIYQLRRSRVTSAGSYWENRVAELAENMGIKRAIGIVQSGIAKLPMVIGHFKPLILVPVGLLTALSTAEIESIILHELAHIRRKDYLVNLLQNLMEIVFFFNPAVLWVSALIRTERENCCDDIVIMETSSKVNYIKALVSCEEYRSAAPAYAMGLGGQNGHFLKRVQRMLSNNNQSLNRAEKMVLTVCLISAVLLTAAFTKADHNLAKVAHKLKIAAASGNPVLKASSPANIVPTPASPVMITTAPTNQSPDTTKKARRQTTSISSDEVAAELISENLISDKNDYVFKLNNNELIINGVKQPDEVYKRVIEKFLGENDHHAFEIVCTNHSQPNSDNVTASAYGDGQSNNVSVSTQSASYGADSRSYGKGSTNYASHNSYGDDSDANEKLQERNQAIGEELIKQGLVKDKNNFNYKLTGTELLVDGVKQPDRTHSLIISKFLKPGETADVFYNYVGTRTHTTGTYNQSRDTYHNNDARQRAEERENEKHIAADLLKDGIISNTEDLNFALTEKEFVVNGVKQDEAVFQRYKSKYVPADAKNNWTWTHSENH